MDKALELAGFFTAHAVWCVADGAPLVPLLAEESADGRRMMRFTEPLLEEGVAKAREHFDANPDRCERAVLVYDGYLQTPQGRRDALFVKLRSHADPVATLGLAIPYRHANSAGGFAVHRLQFTGWEGEGTPDAQAFAEAFFRGAGKALPIASRTIRR